MSSERSMVASKPCPTIPKPFCRCHPRQNGSHRNTKLVCGAGVCVRLHRIARRRRRRELPDAGQAVAGRNGHDRRRIGGAKLHPIQRAFMTLDALQCASARGFVVEAVAFSRQLAPRRRHRRPLAQEIGAALSGHLSGSAL